MSLLLHLNRANNFDNSYMDHGKSNKSRPQEGAKPELPDPQNPATPIQPQHVLSWFFIILRSCHFSFFFVKNFRTNLVPTFNKNGATYFFSNRVFTKML